MGNEIELLKEIVEASINTCFTRAAINNGGITSDEHNTALVRLSLAEENIKKHLISKGIKITTFYDKD